MSGRDIFIRDSAVGTDPRHDIAAFINLENIALGPRGKPDKTLDIQKVLGRLLEKGTIIVKRAYADWSRFPAYTRPFHEPAVELIESHGRGTSGKNSADVRLCVDAIIAGARHGMMD